jgi:hypothetical protein
MRGGGHGGASCEEGASCDGTMSREERHHRPAMRTIDLSRPRMHTEASPDRACIPLRETRHPSAHRMHRVWRGGTGHSAMEGATGHADGVGHGPRQAKPSQAKSSQAKPSQVRRAPVVRAGGEAKSSQANSSQARRAPVVRAGGEEAFRQAEAVDRARVAQRELARRRRLVLLRAAPDAARVVEGAGDDGGGVGCDGAHLCSRAHTVQRPPVSEKSALDVRGGRACAWPVCTVCAPACATCTCGLYACAVGVWELCGLYEP